jgi:hypothetical protein
MGTGATAISELFFLLFLGASLRPSCLGGSSFFSQLRRVVDPRLPVRIKKPPSGVAARSAVEMCSMSLGRRRD